MLTFPAGVFLNERGQKGGTQIRELALSRCLFAGKKSIDQRQLAAALYRREQSRGVTKPADEGRRERKKIKLGKKENSFNREARKRRMEVVCVCEKQRT